MIPIIFHIIRLITGFQSPAELKVSQDWNVEFTALYESRECDMAIEAFENFANESVRILPEIRIKAAHCYYLQRDTANVKIQLNALSGLRNRTQNSTVLNQKALLAAFEGDTLTAINLLKKAIQTENSNTFAKRNYEYLLKVYQPNKNQPPQPNKTPESQNQSDLGGLVAQSNEREDELENTVPPKIGHSQAMQLLNAMRANEFNNLPILSGTSSDTTFYGNW